jgi:hypothetical protein
MSLNRFAVTGSFSAWSPRDRNRPECWIFIGPGPKDLFTDEAQPIGAWIKFLKGGLWFEADRSEFDRSTMPSVVNKALVAQGA